VDAVSATEINFLVFIYFLDFLFGYRPFGRRPFCSLTFLGTALPILSAIGVRDDSGKSEENGIGVLLKEKARFGRGVSGSEL
jgi:hypothetical protein